MRCSSTKNEKLNSSHVDRTTELTFSDIHFNEFREATDGRSYLLDTPKQNHRIRQQGYYPYYRYGNNRNVFCVVVGILCSTLKSMPITVVGIIKSLLSIIFSCYYQAFTLKLELIGIDFLQEKESITISIVLSNSHDNYRLNWNDLDANLAQVNKF